MPKRRAIVLAGIAIGYFAFALAAGIAAWKAAGIAAIAGVAGVMYGSLAEGYVAEFATGPDGRIATKARVLGAVVRIGGALCVLFLVLLLTAFALD